MDMGILKPFEAGRTASNVSPEAGINALGKQTETASGVLSPAPVNKLAAIGQQPADTDREQLQAAVSDIQDFVQSVRRDINFQLDDDSGRVVVNVTEASSGNVIRQIPSEEALRLAENLSEVRSLLFRAEA